MKKTFLFLLSSLCASSCFGNYDETSLRNTLFSNYKKDIIPKQSQDQAVVITMGVGVQNLESFDQMEETIDINMWVRLNWVDENLRWNSSVSNISFLSVSTNSIWIPDIELLNAASIPQIYTLKGGINLYNDGLLMWSNPAIYSFSCALELYRFPFDTQTCIMKFSSWVYDNSLLILVANPDVNKQIDLLESFSHSEWEIVGVILETYNETRECCGNSEFSVNKYIFTLNRYPHYYKLSMGMTISLVIVSFIIMLVKPTNISRTSTAVFIPLTILALQLTLADKIPVVGYYTLMDKFFLCCFITSMLVSIESGIVYVLITSKSEILYKLFYRFYDFKKLNSSKIKSNRVYQEKLLRHDEFIRDLCDSNEPSEIVPLKNKDKGLDILNDESKTDNIQLEEIDCDQKASQEFENISNILRNRHKEINLDDYPVKSPIHEEQQTNIKCEVIYTPKYNVIEEDVIKTIDYDDKYLKLTYKEILFFDEVSRIIKMCDNTFRIILPIIFFSIIIYIMAQE